MSNFTTQVRFICETACGETESRGLADLDRILEAGREYIFDFDYPIFDEAYRIPLETKILKHYYTREISEETVGLWKLRLSARMGEIMPYYNQLYQSELLSFNPLYDADYTRTGNRDGSHASQESTESVNRGSDSMTGTVKDTGLTTETTGTTGTASENTSATGMESRTDTGSATRTGSSTETKTGGVTEVTGSNAVKTNTGTETRNLTSNTTDSGRGTRNTSTSGSDVETTERDNITDHWDYYSDTPQGSIGFIPGSEGTPQAAEELRNQTYLTNVRHVTDDTTGSSEEKTTEYGKETGEVSTEDKTTASTGTDSLTLNTNENTNASGSRDSQTTETGTGTNTETEQKKNAGETVRTDTGRKENTQSTTGQREGTDHSTREYDTRNTRSGSSTGTTTANARNLEEYTEHVIGKMGSGSYSSLLMEFRKTFLNIDLMVIESLSDLFFGLWE